MSCSVFHRSCSVLIKFHGYSWCAIKSDLVHRITDIFMIGEPTCFCSVSFASEVIKMFGSGVTNGREENY